MCHKVRYQCQLQLKSPGIIENIKQEISKMHFVVSRMNNFIQSKFTKYVAAEINRNRISNFQNEAWNVACRILITRSYPLTCKRTIKYLYCILYCILGHGGLFLYKNRRNIKPVPVAARSKAYVYGRSPAEIAGSNRAGDMDVCLLCVFR